MTAEATRRPGGRSARVRAEVLDATLALIDEGHRQLSVPDIATRAGVAASSIYRRWGTWEDVVADALLASSDATIPVPDTGALREDLIAFATSLAHYLTSSRGAGLVRAIATADQSEAFEAARKRFWDTRFDLAEEIVRRAVARDEIPPDVDARLVLELVIAPMHMRQLLLGSDPAERIPAQVDLLLNGIEGHS